MRQLSSWGSQPYFFIPLAKVILKFLSSSSCVQLSEKNAPDIKTWLSYNLTCQKMSSKQPLILLMGCCRSPISQKTHRIHAYTVLQYFLLPSKDKSFQHFEASSPLLRLSPFGAVTFFETLGNYFKQMTPSVVVDLRAAGFIGHLTSNCFQNEFIQNLLKVLLLQLWKQSFVNEICKSRSWRDIWFQRWEEERDLSAEQIERKTVINGAAPLLYTESFSILKANVV